jgi:hypothetical protein
MRPPEAQIVGNNAQDDINELNSVKPFGLPNGVQSAERLSAALE